MTSKNRLIKPAVIVGTAVAVGLTFSCSTTSRQASAHNSRTLRVVHKSGLVEVRNHDIQGSAITGAIAKSQPSKTVPELTPSPVKPDTTPPPAPERQPVTIVQNKATPPSFVPADMLSTGKALTALLVPSQPGFVRSPYTHPPRLVVVKDGVPGTTMICPYTHKPFVVPSGFTNAPEQKISSLASSTGRPAGAPAQQPAASDAKPSDSRSKLIINSKEFGSAFPSPEPGSGSPLKSDFANSPVNVTPGTDARLAQETPFGEPIPGRPGFVNSPFAAKNQLVDVTGLPVGMEVKCPYSGKLFRVPPSDMVSSKPSDTTAPSTSPEQPKRQP